MIIKGDLIQLAKKGEFGVITHSVNCFCRMKRGIAPQLDKAFGCASFPKEAVEFEGDYNKLGTIDFINVEGLWVVNSYMQYHWQETSKYGIPLDYDAMRMCLRKINKLFKNKTIGLPQIGAGLAGGNWTIIESIIYEELQDMTVKIILYDKNI